jgi:hypothetical protein
VAENGYEKTLELKKEQFIQEELPQMFRTLDMLRMDFKDLEKFYHTYKLRSHN